MPPLRAKRGGTQQSQLPGSYTDLLRKSSSRFSNNLHCRLIQIPRNTPFDMADTNSAPVREYKTDLALYEKGRPEYSKESVEFLLNRVGVLPSDNKEPTKLLEIAAGTGKFTRAMVEMLTAKKAKVEIIASDVQREMCDMFRHFVPGIEMLQFPAENMGKIECHMLKLGHWTCQFHRHSIGTPLPLPIEDTIPVGLSVANSDSNTAIQA